MFKLLIVEDEAISREGMRDIVAWERFGIDRPDCACNGAEALEYTARHRVDIVLTDIKMPRMDGMELIARLAERGQPPLIIIMSGFNDFSYAQTAIRYGVLSYLLKPIHMDELEQVLRQAVERLQNPLCASAVEQELLLRFKTQAAQQADALVASLARAVCERDDAAVRAACAGMTALMEQGGFTADIYKRLGFRACFEMLKAVSDYTKSEMLYLDYADRIALITSARDAQQIERQILFCAGELREHIQEVQSSQKRRDINEVIAVIRNQYPDSALQLSTIAESLSLTPNYLSTVFRKQTGKTFSEYLESYRMERAKELLRDVNYKVYEVAYAVGYTSPRNFSKRFRELTGVSPKQYQSETITG
ncbi:MAG: response regulator [Oscillospiraceae bacterium]|nr:response regulator [Oscillospiraceae bacterium]